MNDRITASSPRCHTRILIKQTATGYGFEVSASVDDDDANTAIEELTELLADTIQTAQERIDWLRMQDRPPAPTDLGTAIKLSLEREQREKAERERGDGQEGP